jgi:ABC-type dipeptide/oligopeptide/nickel transport system permease component
VTFLAFILVYLKGDPARSLAGVDTTEENLERIREAYGLNQPLHEQYFFFLRNAVQGDLGRSFHFRMDVLPLVMDKFWATMQLAVVSLIFSILIALPLGVFSALNEGKLVDHVATLVSLLGVSTPNFWLGIILILVLADQFRLLPPSGRSDSLSFVMPALALSGYNIGLMTRLMRRSMLEELRKDYVVVARSKGLSPFNVNVQHALRNALIPTITVAGLQFGTLIGGSIVVETIFAWPGLGFLMIQSIRANDLPIIRAAVLFMGITFVVINLIADITYSILDPRIIYK